MTTSSSILQSGAANSDADPSAGDAPLVGVSAPDAQLLEQSVSQLAVMPSVVTVFTDRAALTERYLGDFVHGGLFIAGHLRLAIGARACVDVALAAERLSVQVLSVVRWKRYRGQPHLPSGVGVEFTDPSPILQFLLRGTGMLPPEAFAARARRFYVSLELVCQHGDQVVTGTTRDISRSGLFIRTSTPVAAGTSVQLRLLPPALPPIELGCVVARVAKDGMGVRFVSGSDEAKEALRRLQLFIQERATKLALDDAGGPPSTPQRP
jgi:Tfp pilus assembly protein PilZ